MLKLERKVQIVISLIGEIPIRVVLLNLIGFSLQMVSKLQTFSHKCKSLSHLAKYQGHHISGRCH